MFESLVKIIINRSSLKIYDFFRKHDFFKVLNEWTSGIDSDETVPPNNLEY